MAARAAYRGQQGRLSEDRKCRIHAGSPAAWGEYTPMADEAALSNRSGFEFDYKVRISPRARHINLRVTPEEGLVVSVPGRGATLVELDAVLREKRAWIERSLAWAEEQRNIYASLPPLTVPCHIDLPGVGESWSVTLVPTPSVNVRARENGFRDLRLSGNVYDTDASFGALRRWLARRARLRLVSRLHLLGRRHGLAVGRTSVRNQKTCWGSYSPGGTISLNMKLLFLPSPLVDYVLLHELCHGVHLDHSHRFWRLMERIQPGFDACRAQLDEAWDHIPAWVGAA